VAASVALAATLLPAPTPLGRISFPTSGSPAAQSAFIRGVLLLHNFEYDDAIDRFREAERLDPGFAMAYWGEAMCYNQALWNGEEIDKARAALGRLAPTRATRAAKAPTAREKAYLDAVEARLGDGDKTTRDRAYADRMADLSHRYPDDDEAAAFYALALLGTIPPGGRNAPASLKAGEIVSAILKRHPQHPGAAHYALHAYDDGEHAAMGLAAARTYAKIAPASSHALHMPSHIFVPLGMWDEAAASDEASWAASMAWIKRKRASLELADFHSLSWLHYEYLQQGRFVRAQEILGPVRAALAELARPNALGAVGGGTGQSLAHQHVESEIGRGFDSVSLRNELGSLRARFIVESGDWEQMKGQSTFDNIDELFALGLSSVRLGDLARADVALGHLENAAKVLIEPDGREIAAIMSTQLDGVLTLALGDRPRGLAALTRAASLEAQRPRPVGRPYPIKPAGELYAEALLESDPAAAVQQFRKALERTPNRASSLLGLARAARAAGSEREAADAAGRFLAIWHLADADRKELDEARSMLK
jgi:tetratricopeptide (TPR) repeat protein